MSAGERRRVLVQERLSAAAEEICALFEATIAEYEEELRRCKLLLDPSGTGLDLGLDQALDHGLKQALRLNQDLDQALEHGLDPVLNLSLDPGLDPGLDKALDPGLDHALDPGLVLDLETVGIKEEPEEGVKLEEEPMQLPVPESSVRVKTEFSLLQLHTEEERPGDDISADPESEEDTDHSSDNDEGWDPLRGSQMEAEGEQHRQHQTPYNQDHASDCVPHSEGDSSHGTSNSEGLQLTFDQLQKQEQIRTVPRVPKSEGDYSHGTFNSEGLELTFDQLLKQEQESTFPLDPCGSLIRNPTHAPPDLRTVAFSTNAGAALLSLPVTPKGSRYNKKQYCLFCQKPFSKLARHLQAAHRGERDVALAFSFKKGSKKRKEMLKTLQKKGNFSHNASVAISGVGELIVCRRPCSSKPSSAYRYCQFCQGLYARQHLWRHVKNCHKECVGGEFKARRKYVRMRFPKPDAVKAAVWKIVCGMSDDEVSATVRSEPYILQVGEALYDSRKPFERRNQRIQQPMQDLARLLIEARATTPLRSAEDLVAPTNLPHVIKAVRSVTGNSSYAVPSLALELGQSLIKMAGVIHGNALAEDRKDVAESAKTFEILYQSKWKESVSAFGTQSKGNKAPLLPFINDVKMLHEFLSAERTKCIKELKEEPDKKSFSNLAKVTLTQVLLFNRRREADVSEMELLSYTSRNFTELAPESAASLGECEKRLAARFQTVKMGGTHFGTVPVLLTPEMTAAMDLLGEKREVCQVPKENAYVFARPEAPSFFSGAECFRDFVKRCGARHPEALTSARLREHVAALSAVLSLKESDADRLADLLGRHVRGEFRRVPESAEQLAKVCKVLMAVENGLVPVESGTRLDDIVIDPEDEVDIDDGDDEGQMGDSADGAVFPEREQISERRVSKRGRRRRPWTLGEVKAVERHMMEFIARGKVPGKRSCDACLLSEPRALRGREWVDIKNYVHNRIMALKKKQKT